MPKGPKSPAMFHAVILAGGGGTRLWPASRRSRPKQFLPLGGKPGETLLRATVRRLGDACGAAPPWIVTAGSQADAVRSELPELPAMHVLAEPAARNTAAAIGLAAVFVKWKDPEAIIAALPADQHVHDEAVFQSALRSALELARSRQAIVTLGIPPTRPETGYGYLEIGEEVEKGAFRVIRFVEKPDRPTAEEYLASGRFFWNAGMFFFPAVRILEEIERHLPETYRALGEIASALEEDGPEAATKIMERVYPKVPSISVDYGIMEKTSGILTVPGNFGWNDVGAWSALFDYRPVDATGNVAQGLVLAHDARGNIAAADPGVALALIGVSDLCVIQSGNAILVVPKDRAQDVREIVRLLEERKLDAYL
ncbi:MAG: mannose-1-phosphate guanylyltransferase [Deltaproteobacteria bacterium]|nr:mannose-1-phosphate guanylyltransferase [Deltaproteobacteria bacterium]